MKLESFYKAKDAIIQTKHQTEWESIFVSSTSDRWLISKLHKELRKQYIKKAKKIKLGIDLNKEFSKEEIQIVEKY